MFGNQKCSQLAQMCLTTPQLRMCKVHISYFSSGDHLGCKKLWKNTAAGLIERHQSGGEMVGGGRRCLMPIYLKYLSDKLPLQPRSSALNRKILLEFFARGILCPLWTVVKYNWSCRGSQAQLWPRKDLSARNVDPPLSVFASFQCSFFGQYSRISLSMFLVCTMFDKFANDVKWQGRLTNKCVCYACC